MAETKDGGVRKFKVRLSSGREVGPLDLESMAKLVERGHVTGGELARRHPEGNWAPIQTIEELRGLFGLANPSPVSSSTTPAETSPTAAAGDDEEEKTYVGPAPTGADEMEDATFVGSISSGDAMSPPVVVETAGLPAATPPPLVPEPMPSAPHASESTVVFSREDLKREGIETPEGHVAGTPIGPKGDSQRSQRNRRILVLGGAVILIGVLRLMAPEPKEPPKLKWDPVRPEIPAMVAAAKADPVASQNETLRGMQAYGRDDLLSYREAVKRFSSAVSKDSSNVRAIAMLAASYLKLIDVSKKDENYFGVILKLLDLARSAKVDGMEVLFADVEYFVAVGKPDAALARIKAYSEGHSWAHDLSLLVAYAALEKGDLKLAADYLNRIPEGQIVTPRVYYLRGQLAEKYDRQVAMQQYLRALGEDEEFKNAVSGGAMKKDHPGRSRDHAKSRLRLADLLVKAKMFPEAARQIEVLLGGPGLLPPVDIARTYYLSSIVKKEQNKSDPALADIQKAIKLDPDNRIYLLEMYAQRAAAGKLTPQLERQSRMYFQMIDAEQLVKDGKPFEALAKLVGLRAENEDSVDLLVEIGNLFMRLNNPASARANYEKAAQLAPKDVKVWSKYISALILSYDWPEAEKAMAIFRKNPDAGSMVDKAAGDLYVRMGKYEDAFGFYRKAMARDSIDPDVYVAMADLMMKLRRFSEAPLFYSLALRVDPLNVDAELGIVRAYAETDGIDPAIQMLQTKLGRATRARAPYLATIAELYIRRKDWEIARTYIEQAQSADPEYAYPWMLLGQLYVNLDGIEKGAIAKAVEAYQSYSDRNPSDPSGYMEMYKILASRGKFEDAEEALDKVVRIYPKYPQFHFFRGQLYARQGNPKVAIQEFRSELEANPGSVPVTLALGESLIEVGDFKGAADRFSEAMQLDATNARAKQLAGYAAYLQKNYTAAIALYQASAALDPNNGLLFKRMGDAYDAVGSREQARQAYRRYLQQEPDAPEREKLMRY